MNALYAATDEVIAAATWTPRSIRGIVYLIAGTAVSASILPPDGLNGNWPAWALVLGCVSVVLQVVIGFIRCARRLKGN